MQPTTRDECLSFLRDALLGPAPAETLIPWIAAHLDLLQSLFGRTDFLRLKLRGPKGVHEVLERFSYLDPETSSHLVLNGAYCGGCGGRVFRAWPGQTSREDIRRFGEEIGRPDIVESGWIHPGLHCFNGCPSVLFNIRRRQDEDADSVNSES